MRVDHAGIDFIKRKEGLRLTAYALNDGRYTIGYGNTFYEDGRAVKWGETITRDRAEQLFSHILQKFETDLKPLITASLTQSQYNAVLSYSYNRGIGSFRASTLRTKINKNPNDPTISAQFVEEWGSNQTYKAALQNRRKEEAELYFSGSAAAPSGLTDNQVYAGLGIILLLIIIKSKNDTEE